MKILIPTDGSKCSDAAVAEVASQPWPDGTEVRLLYALELYPRSLHGASMLPSERYEELESLESARSRSFLDEGAALLKSGGFRAEDVSTLAVVGSPKHAILDDAETWGADLVVLGSHGDGALKRLLLGSVSHAVALHAPCSVRIVRSHSGQQ